LKALARSEAVNVVDLLREWWTTTLGRPDDDRPFLKQPPGTVLLRFYRHAANDLRQLKQKSGKDFAELREMDRLEAMLDPTEVTETFVQRLEAAWRGTLTTSGDKIWDGWLEAVRLGEIPAAWYGPVQKG
jgi:hypothetical protein